MQRKTIINYSVDLLILVTFVLSAVSGIGLMPPEHAESTLSTNQEQSGALRNVMSELHIASSFLLVLGVFGHLALHARWMLATTKALLFRRMSATDALDVGTRSVKA